MAIAIKEHKATANVQSLIAIAIAIAIIHDSLLKTIKHLTAYFHYLTKTIYSPCS
jgi:hypothetical protein